MIPAAKAQVGQADLTGEVRDPSAAIVSSAKVTVTEMQTNQSYTSTTDQAGVYDFGYLKPGVYTLTVEAQGFKRFVREGIQLATGEMVRVDAELVLGSESEIVTVTENASASSNGVRHAGPGHQQS